MKGREKAEAAAWVPFDEMAMWRRRYFWLLVVVVAGGAFGVVWSGWIR